ncbi:MAG: hypothetical protein K9I48_03945 [Sphingobacteriales bacterium]|nr:hypothetical protein [Sphingobacteriales bacterium]
MKKSKKKIIVKVEKTKTGYSAYAVEYNVYSTAKSINELYIHLLEALNFYFEEEEIEITADQLMLQIELQQFFQYYRVLNANFLAQRIGMNATLLSQYVRGVKQPSQKQTQKILLGIQLIGKELSDLDFIQ